MCKVGILDFSLSAEARRPYFAVALSLQSRQIYHNKSYHGKDNTYYRAHGYLFIKEDRRHKHRKHERASLMERIYLSGIEMSRRGSLEIGVYVKADRHYRNVYYYRLYDRDRRAKLVCLLLVCTEDQTADYERKSGKNICIQLKYRVVGLGREVDEKLL